MTLLQIAALVVALQAPCPRCPKADAEAIYSAAEAHNVPADVLTWTAFFESSLNVSAIGKRGELSPVQIMPLGIHARACKLYSEPLTSWDCAARAVSDNWALCGGDWVCFWKTHACGTAKTKCGDKVARYREWKRKTWKY
jgi:hypothetical protein